MANYWTALSAYLAASLLLPFACKSGGDSTGGANGTPVGSIATPLHGPCVDWPVAGEHPVPTAIAPGRDSPWAIAVDRTSVYWTESGGVMSVPISGGAAFPRARTRSATALTVDAENLYFADATGIWSIPLGNGPPTRLFAGPTAAQGLAVDSLHVYWTDSTTGSVMRVPRRGGTATVVATGQNDPTGIAIDSTQVVWSVGQPGSIETVLLSSGGLPIHLASGQNAPQQIALDAQNVYWTNGAGTSPGSVMEVPLAGGTPIALATGQIDPQGIAAASVPGAGTYVYWVNTTGGTLMATAAIGGFQPTVLASGLGRPERIAVGTDSLYWTDNSSGNVMQLACSRGVAAVDASRDATMESAAEPTDFTDSSIEDAANEDDATSFACRYFTPDDGFACTTLQPVCVTTRVGQASTAPPDGSMFLTGSSIQGGTYILSGFVTYSTDPQCRYPLKAITSTALFTPTDATSGTTQTSTISEPVDPSAPTQSETAAGTYTTSGTTITLTTTCPASGGPESGTEPAAVFTGSYAASATQLIIAGDVTTLGLEGGACTFLTFQLYNRLAALAPPPFTDAETSVSDAETTVSDAGTAVDADVTASAHDAGVDSGILRDGGARFRRDGG
jgi:hypothetical protein